MSDSINPNYKISNIVNDNSNTPIVYDGIGYITRGFPSQEQKGFVIFIDVLGVKGIWKRMDPNVVFNNWKEVISDFINSINNSDLNRFSPYLAALSDTIIITCQCSMDYIGLIFEVLIQPFIHALKLKFFLRGAISHGIYYLSPVLTIGRAIDEAALSHNQIEMMGIFTTPKFSKYLFTNGVSFEPNSYVRCNSIYTKPDVQTKQEKYDGIALNWSRNDRDLKLYNILKYEMDIQNEDKIKQKYVNTINFYKDIRKNLH